jgi:uncharacterized repeat protein (TIGR01451 family)
MLAMAGIWVQARADGEPAALDPEPARPLAAEVVSIDPAVKPSAGTSEPRISSRRSGGLSGRLQSLRREEMQQPASVEVVQPQAVVEEATPIRPVSRPVTKPANTPTSAPVEARESDDVELPSGATATLPSVLKRPGARNSTETTSEPTTVEAKPTRSAEPIRTAPSRARQSGLPVTTTSSPAITAANPNTTLTAAPASRPQRAMMLAAGANASLAVETNGPKALTLGKPATYIITVANQGVSEAAEVFVAVNLPQHVELENVSGSVGDADTTPEGNIQRLMWKIDRIAGRGQEKLTLELVPRTADPIDLNVEWTMAPPMTSAKLEVLEPKLTMALKGPKDVLFGQTAVYQVIVSNPGTGDAEDVVVNLASDEGSSDAKKLGTIAAGQQKIIEVSMSASQAGPMAMHFIAKSGDLSAEAEEKVMVRRAKLELAIEAPQLVFAGSEATYKVKVTNTGDAPAESTQVGALLPEGSEYLGGIAGVKAAKNGQIVWSAGTLAPGASGSYEFSIEMKTAGTFEVFLQTKAGDVEAATNASTKVEAVADLKLTVADPQGPKPVGEEVTYEITITNRGTKAARKVGVVINFSEGIDPIGVEGGTADLASGQAVFHPIANIEAGGAHKLKIKAKADRAGSHVFRAEVRCTDPETRLASEQTTRFFGSGVSVTNPAANTAKSEPSGGSFVPSTSAKPIGGGGFKRR